RAVRAATLAGAVAAAGLELGPRLTASLDGHGPVGDPQEPRADGDALSLRIAGDGPATRP
ncbi:MAG: hypothetical protein QOI73_2373, partial [Solirubrobacteraceae bacterium]|nr:hypothetical protein [Solirubrobacteraceae bacterium]